ncbi:MAG: hypothetical protein ACLP7O_11715 [Terracidiphilus sp.]
MTIVHFFVPLFVLQLSLVLAATLTGMNVRRTVKVAERDATAPTAGRRGRELRPATLMDERLFGASSRIRERKVENTFL